MIDAFGNTTAWGPPAIAPVPYDDAAFSASGKWKTAKSAPSYAGTLRSASAKGATLTLTVHGEAFRLLAQTCKTCGKVQIFLDGKLVKTVDTRSRKTKHRQVIWSRTWSSIEKHTIKVVVAGTKGRPNVRVDGMVASR